MPRHPALIAGQRAWLDAKVELSDTNDVVYLRSCRCDRCDHWKPPTGDMRRRGVCGLSGQRKGRSGRCDQFRCGFKGTVEACIHTGVLDGELLKHGSGKRALYSIREIEIGTSDALRLADERRARRQAKRVEIMTRSSTR